MPKVALVETKSSRTDFLQEFDNAFEFDQYQLCSDTSIKKTVTLTLTPVSMTGLFSWAQMPSNTSQKLAQLQNSQDGK